MREESKIKTDVFISHSSQDAKVAQAVCDTLERAGLRCWIAPRDIAPGMDYAEALSQAIATSRSLLLVFSSHANKSRQVAAEIERAFNHGLNILPVLIEKTPMSSGLSYFLSRFHWMDATAPPLESHLEKLPPLVRQLIAGKLRGAPAGVSTARMVVVVCAFLALLVSAVASYLTAPPPPEVKPLLKLFHDRGGTNKHAIDVNYGPLAVHNQVELQASAPPGYHKYVLEILADGKARIYNQEDFQNSPQDPWKYEITDPSGPTTLILLVTKKALDEKARTQLVERISSIKPKPEIASNTQIVWKEGNWTTETFGGKGPAKGNYDRTWANEVRAALAAANGIWFDGRTILVDR